MRSASQHNALVADILEREEAWHYEGGKRDLRLDLLRGFAALAMIADHIGGEHSWLYPLTGGNRFFVSAAEAFVFISGAVMGIVYLNVFLKQGLASTLMKALHRAWTLYVVTVVLTLSFAALAYAAHLSWTPDVSNGGVAQFVLDVLTLHRTIYLADVILLYVLLLLAAAPVVVLISQGHTWLVLAASWTIWALWQISPDSVVLPWSITGNEVFFFPAWQALFVTGIAIGWNRTAVEKWLQRVPRQALFGLLTAAATIVIVLYVAQLTELSTLRSSRLLQDFVFDKGDLPVGRVLIFGMLAVFAFAMTTELWEPLKKTTGWLLLPLGQNALTAYSVHIFVVAATTKLTTTVLSGVSADVVVTTVLQVCGIIAVWLFIRFEPGLTKALWQKAEALAGQVRPPTSTGAGLSGAGAK